MRRACNSKQKLNNHECRCECEELDHWGSCNMIICRILESKTVNFKRHVKLINI